MAISKPDSEKPFSFAIGHLCESIKLVLKFESITIASLLFTFSLSSQNTSSFHMQAPKKLNDLED